MIQVVEGKATIVDLPDPSTWVLHLKHVTLLNLPAVKQLPTSTTVSKEFLQKVLVYLTPHQFDNLHTSRTIKPTGLSDDDIRRAVEMGKFEPCNEREINGPTIPAHVHGVNTFCVPELKGRRRLITEPHLNGVIAKHEIPKVAYPTRLSRRQSLRYARYMIQIDFEAFYDSIPMPTDIRDNFVFRTKDWKYFRLCTLPTGARWSVAVGQAITNVIVDIDTPVTVHTLIDNIMIAAQQGQEAAFLSAVRRILQRIREANLLTSPGREELLSMPDEHLLRLAEKRKHFSRRGVLRVEWQRAHGAELIKKQLPRSFSACVTSSTQTEPSPLRCR
eukprot:gene932-biopygen772